MPETRGWLWLALMLVGAVTAYRVGLLSVSRMDLFVDEAQYWLWGQDLALGYYSKPPLVGWLIGAVTRLAGSDAPFWVRLPAPLLHGVTALLLGGVAARFYDGRVALMVALGYVSLPMVAVASVLMSTDTVMFPFLVLGFAGYLSLLKGAGRGTALLTGVALGLGFLAKYAAIYYLICAGFAAVLLPVARLRVGMVVVVLAGFVLTILPNLIWNLQNGFPTLHHTLDNADWVRDPGTRAGLNPTGLGSFLAAQFMVFGPVLFAALLGMLWRWRHLGVQQRLLLCFSVPIILVVATQALLSNAYANWAAGAYLCATILVVAHLPRSLLWLSFAINGAVSLALPLAVTQADSLRLTGERLVFARYTGRADMSTQIIAAAKEAGVGIVVSDKRDLLADLFYSGRDSGLRIRALPVQQGRRAPHHYALRYPLRDRDAQVLLVSRRGAPASCDDKVIPLGLVSGEAGAYRDKRYRLDVVPARCLLP